MLALLVLLVSPKQSKVPFIGIVWLEERSRAQVRLGGNSIVMAPAAGMG